MIRIHVIGFDPPCPNCMGMLNNAHEAVRLAGVAAVVEKKKLMSPEVLRDYGLVLGPAIAIDGVLVSQGKLLTVESIRELLGG